MTRVKILGAGSIGNHLSNAARALGWDVDLCDLDAAALERARTSIYPWRYGAWDDGICLFLADEAPKGGYDYIFVGTPPDSHMLLALGALEESPRAILVEKPLCTPLLEHTDDLFERAEKRGVMAFTGYDHVVGEASVQVEKIANSGALAAIETIDVEFREHWGGILAAHPWLSGPCDTYLGYWRRGGGASGEHSHAINLWQHFAHCVGAGRVIEVTAVMDYVRDGESEYDKLCLLSLQTETGLVGRVVQDVVTRPPRKWSRIQGENGHVEMVIDYQPGEDAVFWGAHCEAAQEVRIAKTRRDDFIQELSHIEAVVNGNVKNSPISLERGLETMLVIAAAHLSAREGRIVRIDYTRGFGQSALCTA